MNRGASRGGPIGQASCPHKKPQARPTMCRYCVIEDHSAPRLKLSPFCFRQSHYFDLCLTRLILLFQKFPPFLRPLFNLCPNTKSTSSSFVVDKFHWKKVQRSPHLHHCSPEVTLSVERSTDALPTFDLHPSLHNIPSFLPLRSPRLCRLTKRLPSAWFDYMEAAVLGFEGDPVTSEIET